MLMNSPAVWPLLFTLHAGLVCQSKTLTHIKLPVTRTEYSWSNFKTTLRSIQIWWHFFYQKKRKKIKCFISLLWQVQQYKIYSSGKKKKGAGQRILDVSSLGNKTITLSLLQGSGLDFIKRRWSSEGNKSSLYGIESKSKICHTERFCLTELLMKLIYTV